jgi:hypothetical protein
VTGRRTIARASGAASIARLTPLDRTSGEAWFKVISVQGDLAPAGNFPSPNDEMVLIPSNPGT